MAVALTVVAAALRFATLGVQSAWLDESATIDLVHRGLWGMLSHLSRSESTPPLYYVLVWLWTRVFGAGVIGFRTFSALVGTLTVPVLYAAGRQISSKVGLWAAALASVNPAMYYYSQEARSYALLILLCAVALVFWQRALESGSRRDLMWWAGASALALLTHYFALFMFLPEAAILVRQFGVRRVRSPVGVFVLVGAALLPLAVSERSSGQASWIEASSLLSRAAEAPKQFLVGLYGPVEILTAIAAALLAGCAVALALYRADGRERAFARDLVVVLAAAVGVPLLLSVTHILDVFDGRNVIAAWTPWALLLAVGVGCARAGRAGQLVGAAICVLSIAIVVAIDVKPGYQRDNWKGVAAALPARAAGSVVVTPANGLLPLGIYVAKLSKSQGSSAATREVYFVALRVKHTGRAPSYGVVPTVLPGFQLVRLTRTESYAVARFVSARDRKVAPNSLRRLEGEPSAEVLIRS